MSGETVPLILTSKLDKYVWWALRSLRFTSRKNPWGPIK